MKFQTAPFPLLVEFVEGSGLYVEPDVTPALPIVQNGPPGTWVVLAGGDRIPLPTDQIVFADDTGSSARVGFGGMSFEGVKDGLLAFWRVRDLRNEDLLSPERARKMTLDPATVAAVEVEGKRVWP